MRVLSCLSSSQDKFIQRIIGSLLHYARCVDPTMLVAINSIATSRHLGLSKTYEDTVHLLNYAASNPTAIITYHKSDMILHVHSDASYLLEPKACSRIGGFFFLSDKPVDPSKPLNEAPNVAPRTNGSILVECKLLRHVVSSAAEAEIGALFIKTRQAIPA